jgi:hypothetical protein
MKNKGQMQKVHKRKEILKNSKKYCFKKKRRMKTNYSVKYKHNIIKGKKNPKTS